MEISAIYVVNDGWSDGVPPQRIIRLCAAVRNKGGKGGKDEKNNSSPRREHLAR